MPAINLNDQKQVFQTFLNTCPPILQLNFEKRELKILLQYLIVSMVSAEPDFFWVPVLSTYKTHAQQFVR